MAKVRSIATLAAQGDQVSVQILNGLGLLAEEITSTAKPEVEYVLYARISDFAILHQASASEAHEQWEIKIPNLSSNGGSGRIRVRKTADKNGISYALTFKIRKNPQEKEGLITPQVDLSHAIACDDQALQMFKILSESGMVKERFMFPTKDGLTWEVDVFMKEDGTRHEWVKIDLELKDGMAALETLPPLPNGFEDVIRAPHGKRSELEEARVQELYATVFTRPNPFRNTESSLEQQTEQDAKALGVVEDGS